MNEPKFTPGPWQSNGTFISSTTKTEKRGRVSMFAPVCQVTAVFDRWEENNANTHLIKASPLLYSALENLCDSIRLADFEGIPQSDLADMEKRFNEALAALDQARGKV